MFAGATSFDQEVGAWNVSSAVNMASMFNGASSFNRSLRVWRIGSVTDMRFMLDNSGMNPITYADTLIGWEAEAGGDSTPNNIILGAAGLTYDASANTAVTNLTNDHSWTIP